MHGVLSNENVNAISLTFEICLVFHFLQVMNISQLQIMNIHLLSIRACLWQGHASDNLSTKPIGNAVWGVCMTVHSSQVSKDVSEFTGMTLRTPTSTNAIEVHARARQASCSPSATTCKAKGVALLQEAQPLQTALEFFLKASSTFPEAPDSPRPDLK